MAAEASDPVVEIGPGRGILTTHLVERSLQPRLVELDDGLFAELESRHADRADVRVVHGDVLKLDLCSLARIGAAPMSWALTRPRPVVERLLDSCSLAAEVRPERLAPEDFAALAAALSETGWVHPR